MVTWLDRLSRPVVTAGVAVWLMGCTDTTPVGDAKIDVATVSQARGIGNDALQLIDNILRHQGPTDIAAISPAVEGYLKNPLSVLDDTAGLGTLAVVDTGAAAGGWRAPATLPSNLAAALTDYVNSVDKARKILRNALPRGCCEFEAVEAALGDNEMRNPILDGIVRSIDKAALAEAIAISASAHDRMVAALLVADRASLSAIGPLTVDAPIGAVRIAGTGNDNHAADVAVLVDLGGDDRYKLRPARYDEVRAVIDLSGNDIYSGSDLALFGQSSILDLSGDDVYRSTSSGQAAAVGGIGLLYDAAGNDWYEAGIYAQAAATAGFARLTDDLGDDTYRISARGQAFGWPLGFAMLRDRAGDDSYRAVGGLVDTRRRRGGGLSYAQGVGRGLRGWLGGGTGILRDEAGDDVYQAEMFAQGQGYFYGNGVLSDAAGADVYTAARYAQGQGAHAGVGLLEDLAGGDQYKLTVGVGQGMGLDAAIGILADKAGRDRYDAGDLAQGSTTGNGFGLLIDSAGADIYALAKPGLGWGRGRGSRGLPGLAYLIDGIDEDSYLLGGDLMLEVEPTTFGGPLAGRDAGLPAPKPSACPEPGPRDRGGPRSNVSWLGRSAPGFGDEPEARTAYRHIVDSLPGIAAGLLREIAPGEIALTGNLRRILVCFLKDASEPDRADIQAQMIDEVRQGGRHASLAISILRVAPPPTEAALDLASLQQAHADCGTRAGALLMAKAAADAQLDTPETTLDRLNAMAETWLEDPCWQAKSAALSVLRAIRGGDQAVVPDELWSGVPQILRRVAVAESDWDDE